MHIMITVKDRLHAYALVSIQFTCIGLILVSGGPFARSLPLLLAEITGILLGVWAVIVMGWRNVNVSPLVKRDARLVTRGPYAVIRHPMYSAVLLAMWPLIIDGYSLFRLTVGLILTFDLMMKIRYEEGLLKKKFPDYEAYMKATKRLIPFVL
jgi:protein-S-isoprenylcysteine O-methyltransferase Ste14